MTNAVEPVQMIAYSQNDTAGLTIHTNYVDYAQLINGQKHSFLDERPLKSSPLLDTPQTLFASRLKFPQQSHSLQLRPKFAA